MNFNKFDLTNNLNDKSDKLPELLKIGNFIRSEKMPALLPFFIGNGLLIEVNNATKNHAHAQMEYIAFSLLKQVNQDLLKLTLVDIGIATNFPNVHRLTLPNIKFITNEKQLKDELINLYDSARYINTHFLSAQVPNLKLFNETTEYKEPYQILFISNLPLNFGNEEIKLLIDLATQASKCGIYVLATFDNSFLPEITRYNQDLLDNIQLLKNNTISLVLNNNEYELSNLNIPIIQKQFKQYKFSFENYTSQEINSITDNINQNTTSKYSNENNFLSIPIGRAGREEVYFELGAKSDAFHCMIAGQSGTGKSTLLNLIITKIAELYTPEEIRLYLLDYKEGVEFEIYRNHPNIECLLLDNSNINYAVEVLESFEKEFELRGNLFRELGPTINNIDKYNLKSKKKLHRIIMVIDEVQELFTQGYEFNRKINTILNRVAKQGRAFGIHLVFCTQTFADCRIDDGVLKQTRLRIAFRLSDSADCRAILGRENEIPMQLQKYQIVYNSANGLKEKNKIVQTYNFEDENIISILEYKSREYATLISKNKKIIEKKTSREFNNKIISKQTVSVNAVKRELNTPVNFDDYGF